MFIVKSNNLFWDGRDFSDEYPDAKLYRDIEEALLEASNARRKSKADSFVIENYGFDNEEIVLTLKKEKGA